jgi:hypothetical protein
MEDVLMLISSAVFIGLLILPCTLKTDRYLSILFIIPIALQMDGYSASSPAPKKKTPGCLSLHAPSRSPIPRFLGFQLSAELNSEFRILLIGNQSGSC